MEQALGKHVPELINKRQKHFEKTIDKINGSLACSKILGYMTEQEESQEECHSNSPCEFFPLLSLSKASFIFLII